MLAPVPRSPRRGELVTRRRPRTPHGAVLESAPGRAVAARRFRRPAGARRTGRPGPDPARAVGMSVQVEGACVRYLKCGFLAVDLGPLGHPDHLRILLTCLALSIIARERCFRVLRGSLFKWPRGSLFMLPLPACGPCGRATCSYVWKLDPPRPQPRPPGQHRAGPVGLRSRPCGCSPATGRRSPPPPRPAASCSASSRRWPRRAGADPRTHRGRAQGRESPPDGRAARTSCTIHCVRHPSSPHPSPDHPSQQTARGALRLRDPSSPLTRHTPRQITCYL